ncbi:MAG TPA: TVP38/TMEM64 family protein [Geminicoccaceae bacterium]
MSRVKRFSPLVMLLLAITAAFALGLDDYVSFEQLERNRGWLLDFVDRHAFLAPLGFMLIYAIAIALSLPGGAILTIAGGFLFGIVAGTVYAVVAATLGATVVFLIARTALGDSLRQRAGPAVRRMEAGFRENALNYLLFLRLIPAFPFWLVNLVPAFLGVPLGTYVVATAVGIIPGTLVFASVGNGLGTVFETGGRPDLGIVFKPDIILPIIGLAVLAILPVAYRKIKGRQPT